MILGCRDLHRAFNDVEILAGVDFSIEEGQVTGILGPSGCGKSTLLNIISGLVLPDKGFVLYKGEDITGSTGHMSFMHQKDLLLPWKRIDENVAMPLMLRGESRKKAVRVATEYLSEVGLEGFGAHYPSQLSGGMRQRVSFLRTYLFKPELMLLDEPFGSLDTMTRRKMQEWLKNIMTRFHSSIILVTHDIEEAVFLCDRIFLMSDRPSVFIEKIDLEKDKDHDSQRYSTRNVAWFKQIESSLSTGAGLANQKET